MTSFHRKNDILFSGNRFIRFIHNKHEMLIKIKAITSFFQQNASGYVFDPFFQILAPFTRCKNTSAFKLDIRGFKIQRRDGNKNVA